MSVNMRPLFSGWLVFSLTICCLFPGCRSNAPTQGSLFQQIFLSDSSDFRGVNLGDDIQLVRNLSAPLLPRYEDRYGLSFEYKLKPEGELTVDYYSDNLISGIEANKIASIVAQITLDNEVETARLYQEMREYFSRQYSMAMGNYGDYVWSTATRDFRISEVRLRLDESKRGIVLNFVDTHAGTNNEPTEEEVVEEVEEEQPVP